MGKSWWAVIAFGVWMAAIFVIALGADKRKTATAQADWYGGRFEDGPPAVRLAETRRWPRFAAAMAVLAVIVAALSALPATGFADHPITAFGRSVAEQAGVRETAQATEADGGPPAVAASGEVTVAEASDLLGLPVRVPPAPEGFELVDSHYYAAALNAESGGTYALTYAGPDGASFAVYQERASDADFGAQTGSSVRVSLKDGTRAVSVKGAWQASGDGLAWKAGRGQMLVFEIDGVRTTLQYTGPEGSALSLFALADGMTSG
jgi:hypothetical protein